MNSNLDPRAWNLFAGVALVSAGCGPRLASQEGGETGETADTNPEGPEDGPECVDQSDCPVGYGCYDGVCMYYPHHDGWMPYYDCYSDSECGEFQLCKYGYCETFDLPPPDCGDLGLEWSPPIAIDPRSGALALSFADVDADGRDELVVATPSELRVHESGGAEPSSSAREETPITDMVAGDFDGNPGEDVLTLVDDDTVLLYASNGDGSFAPAMANPLQLGFVNGLFAGELDGQSFTDLLGWGGAGAYIDLAGQVEIFTTSQIDAAAVHELGSPDPGFVLRRGALIDFYTLDAQLLSTWEVGGPPLVAAFGREFTSEYVTLLHHQTWSVVQSRSLTQELEEWVIFNVPQRLFAGDLDGSETDELVFFDGQLALVQYNPQQDGDCTHALAIEGLGTPLDAAFGDHDGDGDLELAIVTSGAGVVLFDGG